VKCGAKQDSNWGKEVDVAASELRIEREDGVVPAASFKPCAARSLVPIASFVLLFAAVGCGGSSHRAVTTIAAAQWPQADALFHRDPRWLGSDAAFSVPLRDGRILWLFNDTLVATTRAHVRSQAAFVRNTVAIERGTDPTTASMRFYWGETRGRPSSFFPEQGGRWFWPQHGIRLGRALVVFLHRVKETPKGRPGFDFEGDGWRLAVVENASASPARWRPRLVVPPRGLEGYAVGGAVSRVGRYVVSLAVRQRGLLFTGWLLRWPAAELAAGRLAGAQWWAGRRGWQSASRLEHAPTPITSDAGSECSLTYDRRLGRWILIHSEGFGATTIVVSFAPRIQGPYSRPRLLFRPPESKRPGVLVYAAKGHPELTGADLAVTYATNTFRPQRVLTSPSLYYPRFVRVTFTRAS
jgi:hypothetical protein